MPLPVPVAPDVIVIHASLLTACHPQPAGAVTFTAPAPPSAVNPWFVGKMVRGGFDAVKFTLEELLVVDGSRTGDATVAVLPTIAPLLTEQLRVATNVIVAEAPEASVLKDTTLLLPLPPHTPPGVDRHETKVSETGRLSLTVTDKAGSGPLFTTVIVYVTLLPATIVAAEATLVTPRSAAPYVTQFENSEVLPSGLVAVAVIDSPTTADPLTFTLKVTL